MGCHFLLEGIFLTQGSNLGLLHCRQILYPLSHQGRQNLENGLIYPLPVYIDSCFLSHIDSLLYILHAGLFLLALLRSDSYKNFTFKSCPLSSSPCVRQARRLGPVPFFSIHHFSALASVGYALIMLWVTIFSNAFNMQPLYRLEAANAVSFIMFSGTLHSS